MNTNNNLNKAFLVKNDEFYTQYKDIVNEMQYYDRDIFKDKIIYCNCDDYRKSNFVKYFVTEYNNYKYKTLYATCYNENSNGVCYKYDGTNEKVYLLKSNGDFRSKECLELLQECDIVVTNPPCSLARQFVDVLFEYQKDFIIICNFTLLKYRHVFERLCSGKLTETFTTNFCYFETSSGGMQKIPTRILRSVKYNNPNPFWTLKKSIKDTIYEYDDNFGILCVNNVHDIPRDYYDVMAVPLTYINKYNINQFEIIGISEFLTDGFQKLYGNSQKPHVVINGKEKFTRLFIRRK